jgi:hypothetical protein
VALEFAKLGFDPCDNDECVDTPTTEDPDGIRNTCTRCKIEAAIATIEGMPAPHKQRRADYIRRAQEMYHDEGTIEVDSDAAVSGNADGAYVQAWVFVAREDV